MLLRLCQLKTPWLLLVFFTGGCAFFANPKPAPKKIQQSNITPSWFATNQEHALWDREEKAQAHSFFDVSAELNASTANVVILTPESSKYAYDLDIPSGKRYYTHSFCPQHDVWNKYQGSVWLPTFSIAVMPGYLDQASEPQRVLVFGGAEKFARLAENNSHRVKLVGAFVHQTCQQGNCLGKSNWLSRMIFLAVDPQDEKFGTVTNITELKDKVNWEQTVAVIENFEGRNGVVGKFFPAVRVLSTLELAPALEFFSKNAIQMSQAEVKKIQKSCFSIYNKLWEDVGVEKPEDVRASTPDALRAKLKFREALKKKKLPIGFNARLRDFVKKYYPEITTCGKYVYAGNVNLKPEKFWFLAQMNLFFQLHKEGYFFDCKIKSWAKNYQTLDNEAFHDLKRDIYMCSDKDIDTAMNYMPNFITGLRSSDSFYFRFVEYDTHGFGTHGKIYSWVKVKGKKFDCKYDPNEDIKREVKVYPDDVIWRPREVNDLDDKAKVIY